MIIHIYREWSTDLLRGCITVSILCGNGRSELSSNLVMDGNEVIQMVIHIHIYVEWSTDLLTDLTLLDLMTTEHIHYFQYTLKKCYHTSAITTQNWHIGHCVNFFAIIFNASKHGSLLSPCDYFSKFPWTNFDHFWIFCRIEFRVISVHDPSYTSLSSFSFNPSSLVHNVKGQP